MPAPAQFSWASGTIVDGHTAVLNRIDAGTGPGKIRLYSETDVLLGEIVLTDPAGTVNPTTGQITLTEDTPATGLADDDATWGEIVDSDNNVVGTARTSQGSSAVVGEIVLSSITVQIGATINLVSSTIG